MGKRSNFERIPADFYVTPLAAVAPLIPYLSGGSTFDEPCSGDGSLVRHLESYGLRCTYAGDIRTGQDALARNYYGGGAYNITNPPHTRVVMHPLILHLAGVAPSWLLIDADWMSTKQSAPYLPICSDVVMIGRVKWIADLKFTGKDNYAWYRFDARHKGPTIIHGRSIASQDAALLPGGAP